MDSIVPPRGHSRGDNYDPHTCPIVAHARTARSRDHPARHRAAPRPAARSPRSWSATARCAGRCRAISRARLGRPRDPRGRPAREVPAARLRHRHADRAPRHVGQPARRASATRRRARTITSTSCVGDVTLRLRDPRRFGAVLWHRGDPARHPPARAPRRRAAVRRVHRRRPARRDARAAAAAIKLALMDHRRGRGRRQHLRERKPVPRRHPPAHARRAGSRAARCERLAAAVRATLEDALAAGGSTPARLRAARTGRPATSSSSTSSTTAPARPAGSAGRPIRRIVQGQRSTYSLSRPAKTLRPSFLWAMTRVIASCDIGGHDSSASAEPRAW